MRKPRFLDAEKARTASVLNGIKNDKFYQLSNEEILKINEVQAKNFKILGTD